MGYFGQTRGSPDQFERVPLSPTPRKASTDNSAQCNRLNPGMWRRIWHFGLVSNGFAVTA